MTDAPGGVTAQRVRDAAAAIEGQIVATPCLPSRTLSAITGAEVWLKFENLQFTASFKERGALNRLVRLDAAERTAGVLAVSAGNHAQAVAHHARRLGVRATIVMPRFTPLGKIERTREHGAEVILEGESFDEAREAALALAAARGLTVVHPYDDADVICGQGTVALGMLAAAPALDVLVAPVGGGGLVAGMAVAARDASPGTEVVGVEVDAFPSMHCALRGTAPVFGTTTIADGIAVRVPGVRTLAVARHLATEVLLVSDADVERAIVLLLDVEKTVVEGAGAVGLAALLAHPDRFRGRRVGLVLTGGNIDPLVLADVIERGMARAGRLVRLRLRLPDRPGALARVTACVADAGANIEEVHHRRSGARVPVLSAEVELVLRTRGAAHVADVVAALRAAGTEDVAIAE